MNRKQRIILIAIALSTATLSGCATRADINSLRSEIAELKQISLDARTNAMKASQLATRNQDRIDTTEKLAQSANELAHQTDSKVNQVFKKSMLK